MNKKVVITCIVLSVVLHAALIFYLGNSIPAAAKTPEAKTAYTTAAFIPAPAIKNTGSENKNDTPAPAKAQTASKSNKTKEPETTSLGGYFEAFDYQRSLLIKKIEQNKVYPSAARKPGKEIEGAVGLRISLDKDGALVSLDTVKSSGSSILDWAAAELVKKVVPFKHNLGRQFTCEISVGYWLKN